MTKEQKELLLKELSARMTYGLKVKCCDCDDDYLFTFDEKHMGIGALYTDYYGNPLESPDIILSGCFYGNDIKPYLFPMSSMTDEQKREYIELLQIGPATGIDWLNKNHFDYRGLIQMGLAIDATGLGIYDQ